MEHPGIARVIDAGQTDSGLGSRPYFVMELVSGEPITAYCDQHQQSIDARLDLFTTVCHAVQHAHQRGIIHRDIKPSNILVGEVDGVAVPKVIDFGIAKAITGGQPLTDAILVTNRMELLGTPQYMSPEQADADERAIDTRTDVYSLGVVLYELLTGTTPLDAQSLRSSTYSRMLQMILEQKIERPSTRVSRHGETAQQAARQRNTVVKSLRRRLHGELDWITMKALDPDRDRRYRSAAALAEDIGRHVHHEPVQAGPPTAAYRLRKFVRRHRLGVAAAMIVTLAIVSGAILAVVGMVQARRSAQEAQQINQFMHDVLTSVDPNVHGADVRLADVLSEASATASKRFAGHPELEAQVRDMLGRVYMNLTLFPQSIAEFRKARDIWEFIAGPDDQRALQSQLLVVRNLVNEGRNREAATILADLLPRSERVLGADHPLALEVRRSKGLTQTWLGEPEEGERTLRQALERARSIDADERIIVALLDAIVRNLAFRVKMVNDDRLESVRAELEALSRELVERSARELGPESLQTLRAQLAVAQAVWHRGDFEAAADSCRTILTASAARLGECHAVRIDARAILMWALYRLGEAEESAELCLQNIQCHRSSSNPLVLLGDIYVGLPFLDQGGRWAEGESLAREASDLITGYGGGHGAMLLGSDTYIARFVSLQARPDEAERLFQALLARSSSGEADAEPNLKARVHLHYGSHLVKRGDFDGAEHHLNEATRIQGDPRNGTWDTVSDDVIVALIELHQARGELEKVEHYRRLRAEVLRKPTLYQDEGGSP